LGKKEAANRTAKSRPRLILGLKNTLLSPLEATRSLALPSVGLFSVPA